MWEYRRPAALFLVLFALLLAPARALAADPVPSTTAVALDPAAPAAGASALVRVSVTGSAPTGPVTVTLGSQSWTAELSAGTAELTVGPFRSGTSTLTAAYAGDAQNAASTTSIQVATPTPKVTRKPTLTLVASSALVSVGDLVTLRWVSKGADAVRAAGAWKGVQDARGTVRVRLVTRGKHVFRLSASNAAGRQSARVVVMAARKDKALTLRAPDDLVLPGAKVPVTAGGLAAGESWTLRLAGQVVATGTAGKTGTVATSFVVPKAVAEGVLPLTLTGSNPGRTGAGVLPVIKPKQLTVGLESDSVAQHATQTLSLTGLLPAEPVTVTYRGAKVAEGVADAQGRFALTFDVGRKAGEQSVEVVGGDPSRTGEATFTVTAKDKPGPDI